MNIDELRSVQNREREAASLQNLRPTFYEDAGSFIADLEAERDRAAERADDPFASPEVRRLTDDIETAKSTVEAIYERRVGKVVKMASIAAAEMPTEEENLTNEERELFDELVARITESREHVLEEVLEGDGPGISCSRDPAGRGASGTNDPARSSHGSEPDGSPGPAGRPEPTPEEPSGASTKADATTGASADAPADSFMGGGTPEDGGGRPNDGRSGEQAEGATGERNGGSTGEIPVPPGKAPDAGAAAVEPDADPEPVPAGGVGEPTPGERATEGATGNATDDRQDSDPGTDDTGDGASGRSAVDRALVRITADVGEIFGVDDRAYELSADEVVTLPEANAGPLVERGAAERLE